MSSPGSPSRVVAITMIVLTALAFIGVLVGLAIGQVAVAGASGLVLVLLWFVLRAIQKRGDA